MTLKKVLSILRSTIETKISIVGVVICGLVAIHLVLLVNTQFTLWPEMVVYPYLINNGFLLYKDIINPYPPLFTSFLAIFAGFFGYNPLPYQILTWILILTVDVTIFFVAKKILKNNLMPKVSTAFFALFSIPFGINGLWFDLVQTPLILLSFLYLYRFLNKPYLRFAFYSFFFLTIAFFIKQQVLWIIVWFLAIVLFKFGKEIKKLLKEIPYFIAPFLFLLIFLLFVFWQKQTAVDFIFWTLYFPFFEASKMPGYILWPTLRQLAVVLSLILFFLPILAKRKQATNLIILTGVVLLLFAYPRFDYFHLIPALSVLSLAAMDNARELTKIKNKLRPQYLISLFALIFLTIFTIRFFINNWTNQVRFFEEDIYQTAAILRNIAQENEIIYIQNGPDQLLPLAQVLPIKPWSDEFPWYLEKSTIQDKVIDGLKTQSPKFIIFKPYEPGEQYEIGAYRPAKIADYIDQNYQDFIQISDTLWLKIKK